MHVKLKRWRRDTYEGLFGRVLLRDGEVVVDELRPVRLQLDGVPHHRVEVRKVVVHVDTLVAVTTQRPAGQLRALWMNKKVDPQQTTQEINACERGRFIGRRLTRRP